MEFGQVITNESQVLYVLDYYLFFWLLNVVAYGIIAFGVWRGLGFAQGLNLENILRITLWITSGFGLTRLVLGLFGIGMFFSTMLTPFETIVLLGIPSLALNTMFILSEGIMANREINLMINGTPEQRQLKREAISAFESLRRTTKTVTNA
jgi:hypothetical protein